MANLVKSVLLKIASDDGDTEDKLRRIAEKADELGRKHPDLKVKIDSAAAQAKLAALRMELRKTDDQAASSTSRFGTLGKVLNDLTVGLPASIGQMNMFQKVMAGLNIATGLAEPLVAGLVVAVGGLASGLASAGIGLGIFGVAAKGVYAQVSPDIQKYTTAQQAAMHATSAAAKSTALKQMQNAFNGLTSSQREFAHSIVGAQNQWQAFVTKATPGVARLANQGFGLLPKIFATMQPFLAPVEHALSGIIAMISKGLDSSGFKSFMATMRANTGPIITDIAKAIGNVIRGIGGILKAFMPVSQGLFAGIDSLTAKFAHWGQTLTQHSGFQSLMSMFRGQTPMATSALKSLVSILKVVVSQMTGMSTFSNSKMLLQLADPVLKFAAALLKAHPELVWLVLYGKLGFDALRKLQSGFQGIQTGMKVFKSARQGFNDFTSGFNDASAAESEFSGKWGTLGGQVKSVFSSIGSAASSAWSGIVSGIGTAVTAVREWTIWSKIAALATKVWTGIQAAFDAVMDANPIAIVVIAIAALVAGIILAYQHIAVFRHFVQDVFHGVVAIIGGAISWIKGHWRLLLDILTGPIGLAVNFITQHWHAIEDGVREAFRAVSDAVATAIDWVRSHWPLVLSIITGPIGAAVIFVVRHWQQIVSGAEQMFHDVVSVFTRVQGAILRVVAGAGRWLWDTGAAIIHGLVSGIESAVGGLMSTISRLASDVSGAFSKVLHILSPSRVFMSHGVNIVRGTELGIQQESPRLLARVRQLAGDTSTAFAGGRYGRGAAAAAGGVTVSVTVNGFVGNERELAREIREALRSLKRELGGAELGIA